MKTYVTLMLVFLFHFGFGQSEIDNVSHPFQVLFADDASYIARDEKLNSFDFTRKYGLIRSKGKLVLLHYTGFIFESGPGLIDIREISEQLFQDGNIIRPQISEPREGVTSVTDDQVKDNNEYFNIKLTYPWKHTIQLSRHDRLPIHWKYENESSLPRKFYYEVIVRDLHDRFLLYEQTREDYFEVVLDSLDLPENLIICQITLPALNEVSDEIVVAFEQDHHEESTHSKHYSVTKYQSFIDGLIAIQRNDFELANHLFFLAIDTHEEPRFESLHRQLLEKYPKLKSDLE